MNRPEFAVGVHFWRMEILKTKGQETKKAWVRAGGLELGTDNIQMGVKKRKR
jgi:hypothetical protein